MLLKLALVWITAQRFLAVGFLFELGQREALAEDWKEGGG